MITYIESGKINNNIAMFDVFGWKHEKTTASFIIIGKKVAIIEPGGSSSAGRILEGLKTLNIDFNSVEYIFVSHRHNDHSAGTTTLLQSLPNARVFAHFITLETLKNPEKINNATISLYGELAEPIVPVKDHSRLISINDNEEFDLGNGIVLKAIYTPGHTSDHFMFYEKKNKFIFTGDGAGLFSGKYQTLLPNSFPPSFKYNNYLQSLKKILNLDISIIGFAHYGAISGSNVKDIIVKGIETLKEWKKLMYKPTDTIVEIVTRKYMNQFDLFSENFRKAVFSILVNGFRRNLTTK